MYDFICEKKHVNNGKDNRTDVILEDSYNKLALSESPYVNIQPAKYIYNFISESWKKSNVYAYYTNYIIRL